MEEVEQGGKEEARQGKARTRQGKEEAREGTGKSISNGETGGDDKICLDKTYMFNCIAVLFIFHSCVSIITLIFFIYMCFVCLKK